MRKKDDHFGPEDPIPAPVPPTPDPGPVVDPSAAVVRRNLTYGFAGGYFGLLIMLHIFWLSFGHPDLQALCLVGDGIFAGAAQGIVQHYLAVQVNASGVQLGVRLARRG